MVSRYALIENGNVVNIVLWDGDLETWSPDEGFNAIEATEDTQIGGTYDGTNFHAPPPPPGLTSDKSQITADGVDTATVTYRHDPSETVPASVTFTINGVTQVITTTFLEAQIAVTAAAPGPIDVSVDTLPEFTLLITGV